MTLEISDIQVISYWPSYRLEISCIGPRLKAEGQYSSARACNWAKTKLLEYLNSLKSMGKDVPNIYEYLPQVLKCQHCTIFNINIGCLQI